MPLVYFFTTKTAEAVSQRCSVKKLFLEILQNSQENTCARVSFRVVGLMPGTLLKKRLWQRFFSVNFAKILRTPFLTEQLRWPLLKGGIKDQWDKFNSMRKRRSHEKNSFYCIRDKKREGEEMCHVSDSIQFFHVTSLSSCENIVHNICSVWL